MSPAFLMRVVQMAEPARTSILAMKAKKAAMGGAELVLDEARVGESRLRTSLSGIVRT